MKIKEEQKNRLLVILNVFGRYFVENKAHCWAKTYHHSMGVTRRMVSEFIWAIPIQFFQRFSPLCSSNQSMVHLLRFMGVAWITCVSCLIVRSEEKFLKNLSNQCMYEHRRQGKGGEGESKNQNQWRHLLWTVLKRF